MNARINHPGMPMGMAEIAEALGLTLQAVTARARTLAQRARRH